MSSPRSTIEDGSYSSFPDLLFSTSPYVFNDIESIIESLTAEIDPLKENYKLRYNIVIKDLQIRIFVIERVKLKYSLVMKDLLLHLLQKQNKEYRFYKQLCEGLYSGEPSYININ